MLASCMRKNFYSSSMRPVRSVSSSASDTKSEIEDAFDHVVLLALLTSEYTRVRERMNTDDGNLIWHALGFCDRAS